MKPVCGFDMSAVISALERAKDIAVETVSAQILEDCESYVPVQTGTLAKSASSSSAASSDVPSGHIVWDVDYAKAVYYGSGEGNLWFERAKAQNEGKWVELAEGIIKKSIC